VLYDADTGTWTEAGRQYIERLDALTGVRRERLRFGRWAAAEGLVYDAFDPRVHLRKPMALPPLEWPRYLSIDFGFTNPFVCQWWTEDPDGRLILYKEIYRTGRLVEDHAADILQAIRKGDGHKADVMPVEVICDHDAEDRATLERHLGLSTVPAAKTITDGIQAVQSRLKIRADGKPGLLICRDSLVFTDTALADAHKPKCTQDEMLEYVWDTRRAHGNEGTLREIPVKANDHGMDAMRYLVAARDMVGRPRFRWMTY
jgi:phage terminase large subunit